MKKRLLIGLISIAASLSADDVIWERYMRQTLPQLKKIEGWCSYEKGEKMMRLIYETRPILCVEIGVFGGSSIYPTAAALYYLDEGVVFAIDSWANEDSIKGFEPDTIHYAWWKNIDLERIYHGFDSIIKDHDLNRVCKIIRMNSTQACPMFGEESIDILHIDGNHSEESTFNDVQMYLPKLKKRGYLWFDDSDKNATGRAIQLILENCSYEAERSTTICSLFRKN